MYVCLCKGVSDRLLVQIVRNGAHTVEEVADRCSAGTACGSCRDTIQEIITTTPKVLLPEEHRTSR